MKQTITIEVPEGKVAKQVVNPDGSITISYVNKEPIRSKSWEEFCKNHPNCTNEYYINQHSGIDFRISEPRLPNNLATKEDAEGILALIQLTRLHDEWVGGWIPNLENAVIQYNKIAREFKVVISDTYTLLTFPTSAMARDFLSYFEHLIRKAKKFL